MYKSNIHKKGKKGKHIAQSSMYKCLQLN
uniref:Uncharacterized protein n=1 Tax=Rhizophora mucronata TaxID=61149 RepID=A0A2P2J460_RHIMU